MSKQPANIVSEIIPTAGSFPNNPNLPLLIYKECLEQIDAQSLQQLFEKNGWTNCWDNGIFPFHHFHSNTHEVLGIYSGSCEVQIGGKQGKNFHLAKGDVIILPAGVSHKNIKSSPIFKCIGAYPIDIAYDMHYGKEEEKASAEANIQKVPLPETDPIYGQDGPLFEFWA